MPPTVPLAPARFSTVTVWPVRSAMRVATVRAMVSTEPPGAKGTMIRTGRAGQAPWARAGWAKAGSMAPAARAVRRVMRVVMIRESPELMRQGYRQPTKNSPEIQAPSRFIPFWAAKGAPAPIPA